MNKLNCGNFISGMCKLFGLEMYPSLMRPTRTAAALAEVQDLFSEISDWNEIEVMLDQIEAELLHQSLMNNSEPDVEMVDADDYEPPIADNF